MNIPWFTHYLLYRELILTFNLTTESPLRIGSGKSKSLFSPIDLQVLRITLNGNEVPYIPGSSMKGLFRSVVESILQSNKLRTCLMSMCANDIDTKNPPNTRDKSLQSLIKNNASIEQIIQKLDEYCLTCKIFGSNTYSSHVSFSDAYPKSSVKIGAKTGIAINRRSGAAQEKALYTIEFVQPNMPFEMHINLFNLPNYSIGLLAKVIRLINEGFVKIGGFKSKGFGKLSMNLIGIKGMLNIDGKIIDLSKSNKLPALDDKDKEIEFDYNNPASILNNAERVWEDYVSH